jgi:hypothetical protein
MWRLGVVLAIGCGRAHFDAISGDATTAMDAAGLSGLVVWFDFETPPGAVIPDIVSGHPGSCTTCPVLVPGHRGQGYMFNGVDACIFVPDVGQLAYPAFTLSVWSNRASSGTGMSLVEKLVGPGGNKLNSYQIEIGITPNPVDALSFTSSNGMVANFVWSAPAVVTLGTWQHVAVTWDGHTKRLFVGGAPIAQGTATGIGYDSGAMGIGCDDNGTPSLHYSGVLDEVQIYNRVLTDAEILTLANM